MAVDIDQFITATKVLLELKNTSEYDADLRYFINQGATQLFATGTRSLMCKTVEIDCYKADVDKDFLFFTFTNNDGSSCSCGGKETCKCPSFYYFKDPSSFAFIKQSGYTCGSASNIFTWNNNQIILPSTVTATELTYYYWGLSEDCDGYMVLSSEYEIALSSYAAYNFVSTANRITKYTPEFRNILWQRWIKQFNRLTSEKFARDVRNNKNDIRRMMAYSLTYTKRSNPQGINNGY